MVELPTQQVDILISKNQALQILYLVYIINTNILYNWPAFLATSCLNSGYTSSYESISKNTLLRAT